MDLRCTPPNRRQAPTLAISLADCRICQVQVLLLPEYGPQQTRLAPAARELARAPRDYRALYSRLRIRLAHILWNAAQDALELIEGRADVEPSVTNTELTNGVFVPTSSLFKHGDCSPHLAERFKIPQHQDRVGKVGDVHRSFHVSDQAMLGHRQESRRAETIEVLQQFMHVEDQKLFFRHRILITIQAVDDDSSNGLFFHAGANFICKFPR